MYNKIDLREVPAERLKEISLDLVDIDAQAPEFEPNRQFYFMAKARDYVKRKSAELGRPMTFFTQTFGCPKAFARWCQIHGPDIVLAQFLYRVIGQAFCGYRSGGHLKHGAWRRFSIIF